MLRAKLYSNESTALAATDATFQAMVPRGGRIVRTGSGEPVMGVDGWVLVEAEEEGFMLFACKRQGYVAEMETCTDEVALLMMHYSTAVVNLSFIEYVMEQARCQNQVRRILAKRYLDSKRTPGDESHRAKMQQEFGPAVYGFKVTDRTGRLPVRTDGQTWSDHLGNKPSRELHGYPEYVTVERAEILSKSEGFITITSLVANGAPLPEGCIGVLGRGHYRLTEADYAQWPGDVWIGGKVRKGTSWPAPASCDAKPVEKILVEGELPAIDLTVGGGMPRKLGSDDLRAYQQLTGCVPDEDGTMPFRTKNHEVAELPEGWKSRDIAPAPDLKCGGCGRCKDCDEHAKKSETKKYVFVTRVRVDLNIEVEAVSEEAARERAESLLDEEVTDTAMDGFGFAGTNWKTGAHHVYHVASRGPAR